MEKKIVSLQIEDDLLKEFDAFAKSVGSTRTGLVSLFMKHCVINRELPFKPSDKKKNSLEYDFDDIELPMIIRDILAKYEDK